MAGMPTIEQCAPWRPWGLAGTRKGGRVASFVRGLAHPRTLYFFARENIRGKASNAKKTKQDPLSIPHGGEANDQDETEALLKHKAQLGAP